MSGWRNLHFAVAAVLLLAIAGPARAAPVFYNAQTQVVTYGRAALSPRQVRVFNWFRYQTLYFGAFEIDRVSGRGFGVRGYNRLQDAIKAAHVGCRVVSGHDCTLYATLTPAGFRARASARDGLSLESRSYYRQQYLPNLMQGGEGAVAISDMADIGASWRQPSVAQARAVALGACRTSLERAFGHRLPPVLARAYRRAGLGHCRVIETGRG